MNLLIRKPRDSEGPLCRLLLPEACGDGNPREYRLGISDEPPFFVGAISWYRVPGSVRGLRLHVVRTRYRKRIGTRLLAAVEEEATQRGDRDIHGHIDPTSEPAAPAFLEASGFQRTGGIRTFECELEPVREFFASWRKRPAGAGRIPPGARVIPLTEAPREETARLYAQYIAANPELPGRYLRDLLESGEFDHSPVLLIDGQVEGMLLGNIAPPVVTAAAWVVTPGRRNAWASALLLAEGAETSWNRGCQRIRFSATERSPETVRLAERFRAETVATLDCYARRLHG